MEFGFSVLGNVVKLLILLCVKQDATSSIGAHRDGLTRKNTKKIERRNGVLKTMVLVSRSEIDDTIKFEGGF